jgi:polyisoprenoid-binding protein YceI
MKSFFVAAAAVLSVGTASAQSGTYAIDPTHTFVNFEALHFGTSTLRGRFDKKEGSVQLDSAAKTGKIEITIDPASVSSGVAPLDKHLQSKDFFDVAQHTSIKFTGDKLSFGADNKLTEVTGSLTMLGKTGPVTLKATRFNCYTNPMFKREVCGGDFETTLQRSQWGMKYGLPGIPDNIRLLVQVEAVKQ